MDQEDGNVEIIIISNSSKRKETPIKRLPSLGFDPKHFMEVITSGEMIWQSLNNESHDFTKNLEKIKTFCKEKNFPFPTFVVIRNGNHVLETQNVGKFEQIFQKKQIIKQAKILDCIKTCKKFNVMSKIHNVDYLTNNSIKIHKKIGVHGINLAPEFGVLETTTFLNILDKNKHLTIITF